jgi:hypothetical protein
MGTRRGAGPHPHGGGRGGAASVPTRSASQLALAAEPAPERLALDIRHGEPDWPLASPESSTVKMWGYCRRAAKRKRAPQGREGGQP